LNPIELKEIRKFGYIAFIFFGFLCGIGIWLKKPIPTYFFGFLFMLGAGFIIAPSKLKPVYAVWQKIGHLMGKLITVLILTLAYYLVITPSALIKRIIGGRPLPVKPDKNASTYWVDHVEIFQSVKDRFIYRY